MRRLLAICSSALALSVPASAAETPPARPDAPVIVWNGGPGFRWQDAAIGAAGAIGTGLVAIGVVSRTTRRRNR